jgi:Ser/Thr protein kinase RdoA (MazF antagonist)
MDAVESVGFRCDARILELNSYENRVYQIGIEDQEPVVGKFYRPRRWTDEQILEEHDFTLLLAGQDISVVPPLDLGEGHTLKHFDQFSFALYPRRGGRAPAVDDLDNLEILGRHIARIHAAGRPEPFNKRPTFSLQEFGIDSRDYLLSSGLLPIDLVPAFEALYDGLIPDLQTQLELVPYQAIKLHGDCHMGNVLWRDELPHFVDFDDARSGPAIQDLWMMLSGDRASQEQQIMRILKGYKDFDHFNTAELRLIEPLRTLRMMHHAAWIARRWDDPAFPRAFPYFNSARYWSDHLLELKEQWSKLAEPPIQIYE